MLKSLYEEFYKKAKYDDRITRSYYKKLKERIEKMPNNNDLQNALDCLGEDIKYVHSNKKGLIEAFNDFVVYIKEKKPEVTSMFTRGLDGTQRRIEMIKYLQVPRTNKQVEKNFNISPNTRKDDYTILKKGIEFSGHKIKVDISDYKKSGRNTVDEHYYQSSCNPIVLGLNMSELYFLINILPKQFEGKSEIKEIYIDILHKIYPQLSSYASKLMGINSNEEESKDYETNYEEEYEYLFKRHPLSLIFAQKNMVDYDILYNDDGEQRIIRGRVIDIRDDYFVVKTNSNINKKIKYEDFFEIKDFEDYYKNSTTSCTES